MIGKIIKTFGIEIWNNPKEGMSLIIMLSGGLISAMFGALCFGCEECGKKVLDMIKKG